MAAVTIRSDFGAPQKIKSDTVSTVSPSISHEVVGPDAMIFVFWMLSFKPTFSRSTFTFIKRLLSSSSLSAIRVVSSEIKRWFSFALNFGFMISPLTSYKGLLTEVYLIDCVPLPAILHTTTKVIFPKYTLDSFFILKTLLINPSSSQNSVQTPWLRRPFKTGLLQTSLHLLLFSFPFQIIVIILIIIIDITTTVVSIFIMLNFST